MSVSTKNEVLEASTSSLKSSPKRINNTFSEEIKPYEVFYQLSYMAATSSAGIPRSKTFELARQVKAAPARFFTAIDQLADKMRYSYPDACRMIGERVKSQLVRTFLFRLADALRSGEPLAPFLVREAEVQGENFASEYQRSLESVKKWTDGYTSVNVSVALIVIINMVSTMIYDLGTTTMAAMTFTAIVIGFIVAWVLSRAVPQETMCVPWSVGSSQQRLALRLIKILPPAAVVVVGLLLALKVGLGWVFIAAALCLLPVGIVAMLAEGQVEKKDMEVSSFFRSLGGTASSRGTTLGMALGEMKLDALPCSAPRYRTSGPAVARRRQAGHLLEALWPGNGQFAYRADFGYLL